MKNNKDSMNREKTPSQKNDVEFSKDMTVSKTKRNNKEKASSEKKNRQ